MFMQTKSKPWWNDCSLCISTVVILMTVIICKLCFSFHAVSSLLPGFKPFYLSVYLSLNCASFWNTVRYCSSPVFRFCATWRWGTATLPTTWCCNVSVLQRPVTATTGERVSCSWWSIQSSVWGPWCSCLSGECTTTEEEQNMQTAKTNLGKQSCWFKSCCYHRLKSEPPLIL